MIEKANSQKQQFYFSRPSPFPQLYYVGYIGIIFSIVQFLTGNIPQAVFFMVLSILILLLRAWSHLNIATGTLTDFFAIIPHRTTKIEPIRKVLFSEGRVSQNLNSRGSTSTINYTQFKIILVSGEENIILQEGRNESKLLKKAKNIAENAKVKLEDLTK